jgi:hydrogenase maturation protease
MKRILVYGFGNPGRQDDGLGPAFAEMVEKWARDGHRPNIVCDSNYQLNVEDAQLISEYDIVVFADASVEEHIDHFLFDRIEACNAEVKYTLHAASPGYILELCREMYGKQPETRLMHIKGSEWAFIEGITPTSQRNLQIAFDHFCKWMKDSDL